MAMTLQDLGNVPLNDGVDLDNLPDQMGPSAPPPQPGPYRLRLPRLTLAHFDKVASKDYGERIKLSLREAPLVIVQSATGAHVGEAFPTTITNVPMRRGKGENAPVASDMDYLLRALKVTLPARTNLAYAQALIERTKGGDAEFGGDIEWTWRCDENRHAWFDDASGGTRETEQNGCGEKYYMSNVAKQAVQDATGAVIGQAYPLRIQCGKCGASVRAFANLRGFRE